MEIVPFGKTDLGPAAQTFVEKIAGAIGRLWNPLDAIIQAHVDVNVAKTKARGEVEVEGVRRRALERLAAEETKKEQNLEAIYGRTVELLEPGIDPAKIATIGSSSILKKLVLYPMRKCKLCGRG